ncbi:MAG: hypothetical protein J6A28_00430 [Clostridia bacterium]|nr:hypothetical protein [Clostridia bacterium]
MSHFSDVGFKVGGREDVVKLFNAIHSNAKLPKTVWEFDEHGTQYVIHYIDDIRYISLVNYNKSQIQKVSLGHFNERLSRVNVITRLKDKEGSSDFDTLQVEKDGIPFWFSCGNVDIFNFKEGEELDIRIASFAHYVEVKNANMPIGNKDLEEIQSQEHIQMADESYYSYWKDDQSMGFVSGIINNVKIKKNPLTKKHYYAVDVQCLGLNFAMLIDENLIKKNQLRPGKVLCGEFWNTALLVDEDNPERF